MPVIGIRELSRQTAEVVEKLERSGEPVVITKQGRPIATLSAVSPEQVQDLTLSLAPAFVEARERTEADLEAGRVRSPDKVSAELVKEAEQSPAGRRVLAARQRDLARRQSEIVGQVERLFSETPERLVTRGATIAAAWAESTQALLEGAVQAARQSARMLEEQASGRPKARGRRPVAARKARRATAATARKTGRAKVGASTTARKSGRAKGGRSATTRKTRGVSPRTGAKRAAKVSRSPSRSARRPSRAARSAR